MILTNDLAQKVRELYRTWTVMGPPKNEVARLVLEERMRCAQLARTMIARLPSGEERFATGEEIAQAIEQGVQL